MTPTGWALIALGVITSPIVPFFWLTIIIGAALVLADGLSAALHNTSPETLASVMDDGYDPTPFGQQKIEDAPHFRQWERELAGTWDFRNGAPE